jgi:hypothetical protein
VLCSVGSFRTDVSGLPIGPIFKGQDVKIPSWTPSALKIRPIRSPETSVRNQPTLGNMPEDDRIQMNKNFSVHCLTLKMKISTFRNVGNYTRPTTPSHTQNGLSVHQYRCEHLNLANQCLFTAENVHHSRQQFA